jgi:hypothetical protein
MAIHGDGLTLPSSKLHVMVTSSSGDPAVAEYLPEGEAFQRSAPLLTGQCASLWPPMNWADQLRSKMIRWFHRWSRCGY